MPMLQAALLCDSAQEYNGKMSVLGGFISIVYVSNFPTFSSIMFVGRVSITDDELEQPHEFEVAIEAPSGETTFATKGTAVPSPEVVNENPELYVGLNLVLQLPLVITEVGLHWVHFRADGDLMSSLPLLARLHTASP